MAARGESWRQLNDALKSADEKKCLQMINDELMGAGRLRWLMRIRGRYVVLRNQREVDELNARWSERHGNKSS